MVLAVHLSGCKWDLADCSIGTYLWLTLLRLSFVAVPVFFALSGYLITGILFGTSRRQRNFSGIYLRRVLRIVPLYYPVLALAAVRHLIQRSRLHASQLFYVIYLQNWIRTSL